MTSTAQRSAFAARMRVTLRAAFTGALQLALPPVCAACERARGADERGLVCGRCWAQLRELPHPRCDRCGHPSTAGRACAWCALLAPFVRSARSVCWVPHGSGMSIVQALKYDGWHAVADEIGARLSRLSWPRDVVEERRALVPVPLASSRLRERGYNQSERLAAALAPRWSVPVWDDVLVRGRATRTQTRLTPEERLRNVAGAFVAPDSARRRILGTHLVLVDDVVTTAATLNACAAALFAGGARIVSYVTFGRAPASGDRL